MNGTIIYSEYDGGYETSAVLVRDNTLKYIKNEKWWSACTPGGDPMFLDGFELFDLFDKIFGEETYDKVIILDNSKLVKARMRGKFDPSKDNVYQVVEFRGDGEAVKIIEEKRCKIEVKA